MSDTRALPVEQTLLLSGPDWHIAEEQPTADAYPLNAIAPQGWIPAQVPGNIQADLERNHLLTPLWYGLGDPRLVDVARKNWWYRKAFSVPDAFQGRHLELVFEGVDYSGQIWVNGQLAGSHAGMYQRFTVDVTNRVHFDAPNELAIRIDAMPEELVPWLVGSDGKSSGEGTEYYFVTAMDKTRQVLKGLKSATTFSYDWGTNIWALGIWKDVTLRATGAARIEWVQVRTTLTDDFQQATVHVQLDVLSDIGTEAQLIFSIQGHGANVQSTLPVSLVKGRNTVYAQLSVDTPALWWPNEYGAQPLYDLTTTLSPGTGGPAHDVRTTRFGIRRIEWIQVEGAPVAFINPLQLLVNGVPVRVMGSSLVSPDLLPGRIGERGRFYVERAKACHMTMLRLHAGQPLPQCVFEAADELGLLLNVDFPLANSNCGPENQSEEFLSNLDETVRNYIRQLKNYASIVEWSGGNEMGWQNGWDFAALHMLERVTAEEDDRIFRATCPAQGVRHSPWDYNPQLHYELYNRPDMRDQAGAFPIMRHGEFGCQTPANVQVWYRDIPPASRWPVNVEDPVLIRKNAVEAAGRDLWLFKYVIEQMFGDLDGFEMMIKGGQFLAGEGLRYAIDALRARGKTFGGFTTWDFNEPWPNGAGSFLVDYDGQPVMQYAFAKQGMAPVSLSLHYDSIFYSVFHGMEAELKLIADVPAAVNDLEWRWTARDRRGQVFGSGTGRMSINPQEVLTLDKIALLPPLETRPGPFFVELRLADAAGTVLTERLYMFGGRGVRSPFQGLLKASTPDTDYGAAYMTTGMVGGAVARTTVSASIGHSRRDPQTEALAVIIENTGLMTALLCEVSPLLEYRTDLFVDNQFTCVPPEESRTVTISALLPLDGGLTLEQLGWTVECWNADPVVMMPSEDVLLWMGRKDDTCRQFHESCVPAGDLQPRMIGSAVDPASVSLCLSDEIRFPFEVVDERARAVWLRVHTADQGAYGGALVVAILNGTEQLQDLPTGLGIQKTDPAHLAFPATLAFPFAPGVLQPGTNTLCVRVIGGGWFTWDAMALVAEE